MTTYKLIDAKTAKHITKEAIEKHDAYMLNYLRDEFAVRLHTSDQYYTMFDKMDASTQVWYRLSDELKALGYKVYILSTIVKVSWED